MSYLNNKIDRPVADSSEDLFEWDRYVETLATSLGQVPLPFTIGIYGEWGEGKTSFVNLLLKQIQDESEENSRETIRINFSAWPFNDSETLWKALIFKIADKLMEGYHSKGPDAPSTKRGWLNKSVFSWNIGKKTGVDDVQQIYQELMDKINSLSFIGITKSREKQSQVHNNELLANLVLTGVDMVTKVSPVLAGMKDLIGVESDQIREIFKGNKKGVHEGQIKFVDEFRELLGELFKRRAKDKTVYVFIDDLDRCFPDVALDILESIKIFLNSIPCVFIVAVDLSLIGEGLRMRFRDLVLSKGDSSLADFIQEKGKRYIEKIIQFQVNIPPRSSAMAKRFISAQFPRWTIASDIVNLGVGGNPRRLIQHCNSLSYYYSVYENIKNKNNISGNNSSKLSGKEKLLVDKLLALGSLDQKMVGMLGKVLSCPNLSSDHKDLFLQSLDYWESQSDTCSNTEFSEAEELCAMIEHLEAKKNHRALMEVMSCTPTLSMIDERLLLTLISFSDLHVDEEGDSVFLTRNKVFSRVLMRVRQGEISGDLLLEEDFKKIIILFKDKGAKEKLSLLKEIADSGNWMELMSQFEESLAQIYRPIHDEVRDNLSTKKLYEEVMGNTNREYFLDGPQLSLITKDSFLLIFELLSPHLDEFETKDSIDGPAIVSELISSVKSDADIEDRKNKVIQFYQILIELASYLLSLRTFAKLEILMSNWEEHAIGLKEIGLSYLIYLENLYRESSEAPLSSELGDEQIPIDEKKAKKLRELLISPPLFQEVKEKEVFQFFAAASTLVLDSSSKPSTKIQSPTDEVYSYLNLQIHLELLPPQPKENPQKEDHLSEEVIKLQIIYPGSQGGQIEKRETRIQKRVINNLINAPRYLFNQSIVSIAETRGFELVDKFRPFQSVEELGARIFSLLFSSKKVEDIEKDQLSVRDDLMKDFYNYLEGLPNERFRLIFNIRSKELSKIPWETIFFPHKKLFPALMGRKFSILRLVDFKEGEVNTKLVGYRTFFSPLRILVVTSNPQDVGYLDSYQERKVIRESLASASKRRLVEIYELKNASFEDLQAAILDFNPHVFHFGGHATGNSDSGGALVFEKKKDRSKDIVPIKKIKETLANDSSIVLAVLNGCDTGITDHEDVNASVAGEMVRGGVPIVIASNRRILDMVSISFAREFYRVLGEGYPIEVAFIEARKYLKYWNWDWSAYSIFANREFVHQIPELRISHVSRGPKIPDV